MISITGIFMAVDLDKFGVLRAYGTVDNFLF